MLMTSHDRESYHNSYKLSRKSYNMSLIIHGFSTGVFHTRLFCIRKLGWNSMETQHKWRFLTPLMTKPRDRRALLTLAVMQRKHCAPTVTYRYANKSLSMARFRRLPRRPTDPRNWVIKILCAAAVVVWILINIGSGIPPNFTPDCRRPPAAYPLQLHTVHRIISGQGAHSWLDSLHE